MTNNMAERPAAPVTDAAGAAMKKCCIANKIDCVFCGAPLRPREETSRHGIGPGAEDYYPCACTVAERPDVLARFSLQEARAREGRLDVFLRKTAEFPKAAIFAAKGTYFPGLVPEAYRQSALWVVRLPELLEQHLDELAGEWLGDWTVYSTDLMCARTHLYWKLKAINVHFAISGFHGLFPAFGDKPCVLFLFISGETVVLSLLPIDEGFGAALQARGINTDDNYRPYERFTDLELAIAELDATQQAAHVTPQSDRILPDGTIDYELAAFFLAEGSKPD